MRFGILSDIHGNLCALETVIASAGHLDGWICLGDIVGYGPRPNECVSLVRKIAKVALIGNHDLAAIGRMDISWFNPFARAAARWTQTALTTESREYLESLPETWSDAEWDVICAHGSLTDPPRDYVVNRLQARVNFRLMDRQVLFVGHSHLSHCFTLELSSGACDEDSFHGTSSVSLYPEYHYIINCGSVGQPRDGDPRAAYGVLDLDRRTVDVIRVDYAIETVQNQMFEAGLPNILAERLEAGL